MPSMESHNGLPIAEIRSMADYHPSYRFVRNDIAPLLKPNAITAVLDVADYGGIAALMFSAQ